MHPGLLSNWTILSYEYGPSVIISGYGLIKLKKEDKQCHAFFMSILQIIAFGTDVGFLMYKEIGKSWDLGKS